MTRLERAARTLNLGDALVATGVLVATGLLAPAVLSVVATGLFAFRLLFR